MSNIRSNTQWLAFAQASRILLQIASITLLARLLTPEYYGLMAMALPIINFAGIFRDSGISAAIIQAPTLDEDKWNVAFWTSTGLGFVVGLLVCAVAYPAALFFREPELFWVVVAVSVSFPLAGLSAPHQALAERNGRFRRVALIELIAQSLALLVAIACALIGMGVYALVLQTIVASLVVMVGQLLGAPWRPRFVFNRAAVREVLQFSKGLLGFNLVNYFSRNSDTYIIGRALGATVLGVYNIAYRLMIFPLQSVTLVANRALFPELSRNQNSPQEMRRIYFGGIEFIAMLTFPVMAGLWCLRESFVGTVFGAKWLSLGDLIFWLAPVGLLQSVTSTTGPVLMAKGRTAQLFKLGIVGAVCQVGGIVAGAFHNVIAVAVGYLIGNLFYMVFQFRAVDSIISARFSNYLRALRPAAFSVVAEVFAVLCFLHFWQQQLSDLHELLLGAVIGALAYLVTMLAFFPSTLQRLRRPKPARVAS